MLHVETDCIVLNSDALGDTKSSTSNSCARRRVRGKNSQLLFDATIRLSAPPTNCIAGGSGSGTLHEKSRNSWHEYWFYINRSLAEIPLDGLAEAADSLAGQLELMW